MELPKLPGVRQPGKFGLDITLDEGYATARAVALTVMATIKAHTGDLDRVKRVLRLFGMVNSTPDFTLNPRRSSTAPPTSPSNSAVPVSANTPAPPSRISLPRGIAVEINGEFEVIP